MAVNATQSAMFAAVPQGGSEYFMHQFDKHHSAVMSLIACDFYDTVRRCLSPSRDQPGIDNINEDHRIDKTRGLGPDH